MEIFISIIIISIITIIFLVLFKQNNSSNNLELEDHESLEEWDCPECGFHIQIGDSCTYCYEQKPL